ncbi:hypothetical protein CC1G_08399 [Coprinopsis cinerea okayama7|uniref:Uncharacterized protein n=1 Tax=Coprinopsis cinerea (strain Okayama-7 / 130 / ATCC MYA-4618 / FGSC 9003) TaxID=240176 RepID=A8NAN0_COPC7|nr:hypothetical protein CC1G_08399 [Coprinopsis cinerea okayama7\|eukprot:XP_001831882.2 hypothetical protein CC1G_08399 [Coprinopsis cinerea okayama7\
MFNLEAQPFRIFHWDKGRVDFWLRELRTDESVVLMVEELKIDQVCVHFMAVGAKYQRLGKAVWTSIRNGRQTGNVKGCPASSGRSLSNDVHWELLGSKMTEEPGVSVKLGCAHCASCGPPLSPWLYQGYWWNAEQATSDSRVSAASAVTGYWALANPRGNGADDEGECRPRPVERIETKIVVGRDIEQREQEEVMVPKNPVCRLDRGGRVTKTLNPRARRYGEDRAGGVKVVSLSLADAYFGRGVKAPSGHVSLPLRVIRLKRMSTPTTASKSPRYQDGDASSVKKKRTYTQVQNSVLQEDPASRQWPRT